MSPLGVVDMRCTIQITLQGKNFGTQLLGEQSTDSFQHLAAAESASAAENHSNKGHALAKAWLIVVRI